MINPIYLVLAVLIGLIPATIAHEKNHNFFLWWLFGTAAWIVALPWSLTLKNEKAQARHAAQLADYDRWTATGQGAIPVADSRPCPFCAQTIGPAATVCHHCDRDLEAADRAGRPMTGAQMAAALRAGRGD